MTSEKMAALDLWCDTQRVFDERHRLGIEPPRSFKEQLRLIHVTQDLDRRQLLAALVPGGYIVFEDRIFGRGNFARGYEQVVVLRR
jgi:hypothetical protein